jgi:hypothetical protein
MFLVCPVASTGKRVRHVRVLVLVERLHFIGRKYHRFSSFAFICTGWKIIGGPAGDCAVLRLPKTLRQSPADNPPSRLFS